MNKETKLLICEDCIRYRPQFMSWPKIKQFGFIASHYIYDPIFRLVLWYRIGHELYKRGKHKFVLCFFEWIHRRHEYKTGIQFDLPTEIAGGLGFAHFSGIILTRYSKYGKNLTVFQGVTVGVVMGGGGNNGCPTIGDNVVLCSGCIVIGNVKVGNNACVGAGAVVTKDVPDNAVVVGNPARVISYKGTQISKCYK